MLPAVDVHQHLWPEAFVAALSRRPEPPCLRGAVLRLPGERDSEADLRPMGSTCASGCSTGTASTSRSSRSPLARDGSGGRARRASTTRLFSSSSRASGRLQALAAGACLRASPERASRPPLSSPESTRCSPSFARPDRCCSSIPGHRRELPAGRTVLVARNRRLHRADAGRLRHLARARRGALPVRSGRLLHPRRRRARSSSSGMRSRGVDDRSVIHPNVFFDTSSYGRRALELCLVDLRGQPARLRERRARDRLPTDARGGPGLRRGGRADRHRERPPGALLDALR